jgi:hypothetical protein
MNTPALFIIGARWYGVILPPTSSQFSAVYLFTGGTGISSGNNGIVFIDDDCPEIPAEAGALVGAPEGEIKEILVAVGSHHREICYGTVKKCSSSDPYNKPVPKNNREPGAMVNMNHHEENL